MHKLVCEGYTSASWGYSGCVMCSGGLVRESTMKPVGKPDARNGHVRFDERGWETGRRFASAPAPGLDSTIFPGGGSANELFFRDFDLEVSREFGVFGHFLA